MSVPTTIFNIPAPSPLTKFKDLGAELLAFANSIDTLLAAFDYGGADPNLVLSRTAALETWRTATQPTIDRAAFFRGTSAQRTAWTTAPDRVRWQDTNGSKQLYLRVGSTWQLVSTFQQAGFELVQNAPAANTPYSKTVTFSVAFETVPVVVATAEAASTVGLPAVTITNRTKTGFQVNMSAGLAISQLAVNWIATGA